MSEDIKKWLEENGVRYEIFNNMFLIPYESTLVMIHTVEWNEKKIVEVIASVAIDIKPNMELFKFLLEKNSEIPFGKFSFVEEGIDKKPTVFYSHYLLEKFMQKEEFEASLATVMAVAYTFDEDVAKLGGGLTFREYVQKMGEGGKSNVFKDLVCFGSGIFPFILCVWSWLWPILGIIAAIYGYRRSKKEKERYVYPPPQTVVYAQQPSPAVVPQNILSSASSDPA